MENVILYLKQAKNIEKYKKEKDKKIKTHKRIFSRVLAKDFLKRLEQNTL